MPSLYFVALSPPCRAVVLTANLLNVELELIPTDLLAGDHLKPDFVKLNPQHTIPLLIDDAAIISDSHAICAYLVEKYGKDDTLYPKDLVKRAHVDALLHFDTGFVFARTRFLFEPILYSGATKLDTDNMEYVSRAWPILEKYLETNHFLCGDCLTIADICCEASLCSVYQTVPIDAEKYPKLTSWRMRMASVLPNYERDCHAGGVQAQDIIRSRTN